MGMDWNDQVELGHLAKGKYFVISSQNILESII